MDELILLIDDEDIVRDITRLMLVRLGYSVIAASDGFEALDLFHKHKDEIFCVISDLTMPKLNGLQVLAILRKTSPGIPVIIYSGNLCDEDGHFESPNVFLLKPYTTKELHDALIKATGTGRRELMTESSTCGYPHRGEIVKEIPEEMFNALSRKCPWRSVLKCNVLHSAGRFGKDGCKKDNCGVLFWIELLDNGMKVK